ncbi:Glycine rich protein [Abeliophyllum distichum]|uniref:Glycine rich protein n=1 Tax=Abeliophyllum distichum TaxID=126358 RepID=A0ABD1QX28_9LAMI
MMSKTFIVFGLVFAVLFIFSATAVDTSQDDTKDIADDKDHYGGGWGGGGWGGWGGYGGGGRGGGGGGWGSGGGGWGGWGGGGGGWGGGGPCRWGCCGYHKWEGCRCCYSPHEAMAYMKQNEAVSRP